MILATLEELPYDRVVLRESLAQVLRLAGITDLSTLQLQKAQGRSVFGELRSYPQASSEDVARLRQQIEAVMAELPQITAPSGQQLPGDWTPVTTPAAAITILETRYAPPTTR